MLYRTQYTSVYQHNVLAHPWTGTFLQSLPFTAAVLLILSGGGGGHGDHLVVLILQALEVQLVLLRDGVFGALLGETDRDRGSGRERERENRYVSHLSQISMLYLKETLLLENPQTKQ